MENSGGDAGSQAAHVQAIRTARDYRSPGFADAVEWVSGLEDHINIQVKEGKALQAEAANLAIINAAAEIVASVERLHWDWQNGCVASVRQRVAAALRRSRQITQDGLVLTLRDALGSTVGKTLVQRLRERYRVGLIDESQDTDPRQFEIFRSIFIGVKGEKPPPEHRLVMIGDPKQAIYGFRGADVNTYLRARQQAEKVFTLTKTYRLPPPWCGRSMRSLSASNRCSRPAWNFTPRSLDRQGTPGSTSMASRARAGSRRGSSRMAARFAAPAARERIASCLASRRRSSVCSRAAKFAMDHRRAPPVQPRDIAVLTFSNSEAEAMATALRARGVPAVVATGEDVMATEEAAELLRILRALNEPRRSGLRYSALATRLLGFGLDRLQDIQRNSAKDDEILRKFDQWQLCWERKGIAAALAWMDEEELITARLAAVESGERRVTNFRQMVDLLQAASQEHSPRPEHLLRWLEQEIGRAGGQVAADERQMQLESDRAAVQGLTMHKSKRLEYSLVFVPFLWASHPGNGIRVLASSGEGVKDNLVHERLAEDSVRHSLAQTAFEDRLRLAYVAMTRAKVKLWLFGGEMGTPNNSKGIVNAHPLDWLLRDGSAPVATPAEFVAWSAPAAGSGRGSRHLAGLGALFPDNSGELLLVKEPPEPSPEIWSPSSGPGAAGLRALPMPVIPPVWSVTSFSSMTYEANPHGVKDAVLAPPAAAVAGSVKNAGGFNLFNLVPGGLLL